MDPTSLASLEEGEFHFMGRATGQGGVWRRGPQSHDGQDLNAAVSHGSSEEELEPGEEPTL